MTFEEILDQAIAMLQRRERVTYRALKLQFKLDDEYLEALKEELIEAQHVATEEDGRILVWTGDVAVGEADARHRAAAASRFYRVVRTFVRKYPLRASLKGIGQ